MAYEKAQHSLLMTSSAEGLPLDLSFAEFYRWTCAPPRQNARAAGFWSSCTDANNESGRPRASIAIFDLLYSTACAASDMRDLEFGVAGCRRARNETDQAGCADSGNTRLLWLLPRREGQAKASKFAGM